VIEHGLCTQLSLLTSYNTVYIPFSEIIIQRYSKLAQISRTGSLDELQNIYKPNLQATIDCMTYDHINHLQNTVLGGKQVNDCPI